MIIYDHVESYMIISHFVFWSQDVWELLAQRKYCIVKNIAVPQPPDARNRVHLFDAASYDSVRATALTASAEDSRPRYM